MLFPTLSNISYAMLLVLARLSYATPLAPSSDAVSDFTSSSPAFNASHEAGNDTTKRVAWSWKLGPEPDYSSLWPDPSREEFCRSLDTYGVGAEGNCISWAELIPGHWTEMAMWRFQFFFGTTGRWWCMRPNSHFLLRKHWLEEFPNKHLAASGVNNLPNNFFPSMAAGSQLPFPCGSAQRDVRVYFRPDMDAWIAEYSEVMGIGEALAECVVNTMRIKWDKMTGCQRVYDFEIPQRFWPKGWRPENPATIAPQTDPPANRAVARGRNKAKASNETEIELN